MRRWREFFGREALLLLLIAVVAGSFGATVPGYLDPANLGDRLRYLVETGLIAVPMTFIIASGGIDLSVGSLLALAGVAAGLAHTRAGWPLSATIGLALVVGAAGGLVNALAIQALRLPALVVTLATLALYRGLAFGLTGARSISEWPEAFTDWGSTGGLQIGEHWNVPWSFLLLLGVTAVGAAVFDRHTLGRQTRQLGENGSAARFAGISAARVQFAIYGASGLACGLAAVVWTARFATAHPGAAQGMELDVIAVVVVGGTRITGGAGSVIGTFLGLVLLGLLRYGLDMCSVSQQDQTILLGLLVVAIAVTNEAWARRKPG
jgi:rhamnose transport system permease protein